MEIDQPAVLVQTKVSIDAACGRVTQQLALIAERERCGLPVTGEEAVLCEMRVSLGLAYACEMILLADIRHAGMSRILR
jgi:hypothetical protein